MPSFAFAPTIDMLDTLAAANDDAWKLSDVIGDAWVAFAATGDPGWRAHPHTKVLK